MLSAVAFVLLGIAVPNGMPCENLTSLKLDHATITSAAVVPEGPAPTRGGGGAARGGGGAARGAAGGGRAAAPAPNLPAHCQVKVVLKPTPDSLINMEMWLPTQNWNGKFMGVGNGGHLLESFS